VGRSGRTAFDSAITVAATNEQQRSGVKQQFHVSANARVSPLRATFGGNKDNDGNAVVGT